jgi:hypothetical protein
MKGIRRDTAGCGVGLILVAMLGIRAPAQKACSWTSPIALTGANGRPAYVEAPSVIAQGREILLVGPPALEWPALDSSSTGERPTALVYLGLAIDTAGRVTRTLPLLEPLLESHRTMYWPEVVVTSDGQMHMVWLERNDDNNLKPGEQRRNWLLHSRYDGRSWTKPVEILTAMTIHWSPGASSRLIARGNTLLLGVTSATAGDVGGRLNVLRYSGRWSSTSLLGGFPDFATLFPIANDTHVLAGFSDSDQKADESNGSHPFVARLALDDSSHSAAVRVAWQGLDGASYLNAVPQRDSKLALSWLISPRRGGVDSLAISFSTDDGRTWNRPIVTSLGVRAHSIAAETDGAGRLYVIYWDEESERLGYALWDAARWRIDGLLAMPSAQSYPRLSMIARDTLLLVWGHALPWPGQPGSRAPQTLLSRLATRCN